MKTSQHTYEKNKGFWIHEADFEIVSHYIALAFKQKELSNKPEWYLNIYEDFQEISKGHYQNYAYLNFKDDLNFKKERELQIIEILELTKDIVLKEGDYLTKEKLNSIDKKNKDWGEDTRVEWIANIYTEDIIGVIDILIKMLKHQWHEDIDIKWPKRN